MKNKKLTSCQIPCQGMLTLYTDTAPSRCPAPKTGRTYSAAEAIPFEPSRPRGVTVIQCTRPHVRLNYVVWQN